MRKRFLSAGGVVALLTGVLALSPSSSAVATPVATDEAQYQAFGRVFPDPHGCMPRSKPFSPHAQGKVCATDFIQFHEMIAGLRFLERTFPDFIDVVRLDEEYDNESYRSAGLATADLERERNPLYMVRVTDERVSDAGKKYFVFPLSIHGIERAGVEGGVRAIEDLATWAAREPGHPLVESDDRSVDAATALRKTAVYFIFPNPDGWRRGDRDNGVFYQRYNGNGIDLNRDWPATGFTYEPYTPLSEPESKSFARVLKGIRGTWDGGIDLHGQLIDRAFSFTLLGQGQHDFGKNQAMLQIVQGAWKDAEARLAWSPLIKPNDAPADAPGVYGVQWGTVWDTIGYTITGSLGDWINQPQGLDAIGIDNEMSLSHVSNCGTGVCYEPDVEQLHVDGNKSLIYSMINFSLKPEDTTFRFAGRAAYLDSDRVVTSASKPPFTSAVAGLEPQGDVALSLTPENEWTQEFEVQGPSEDVFNGGLKVTVQMVNAAAVSPGARAAVLVERKEKGEWEVVNSYYNQSFVYLQAGQSVDVNEPDPGQWRVRVDRPGNGVVFKGVVDFSGRLAWDDPGQRPYRVTNLRFFPDLNRYVKTPLEAVDADRILSGETSLDEFDTLVIADDMLPGFSEPARSGPAQGTITIAGTDGRPTYPCAGHTASDPTPGCETYYEWTADVDKNNQSMTVRLEWLEGANDFDLYVERFAQKGQYWSPVAAAAGSDNPEVAKLVKPIPGRYRARVVNWASVEPVPQKIEVSFSNEAVGTTPASKRTRAELASFAEALAAFVERGGNLVLTDGALRLLHPMGIVPRTAIHEFTGFAGFIGFTSDGKDATYGDPLAKNLQRPGAAEGPFHRHQTYDPGVVGFDIGGDTERRNTAPIWAVDQTVWERLGGRTAGTSTGDQVTLGELEMGAGRIRVIGAVLPMPTNNYFHPNGLGNYAVTYSGYQVLQNALSWRAPARVLGAREDRPIARTGVPLGLWAGLGILTLAIAETVRRWRGRGA